MGDESQGAHRQPVHLAFAQSESQVTEGFRTGLSLLGERPGNDNCIFATLRRACSAHNRGDVTDPPRK